MKAILVLLLLFSLSAFGSVVYTNDFSTAVGPELSVDSGSLGLINTPLSCVGNGSAFCGSFLGRSNGNPLDNHTVTLSLAGLPGHDTVEVSFLLFLASSWDGNFPLLIGPDRFRVALDAVTGLDTTFSNFPGIYGQAYPGTFGSSDVLGQTGAVEVNKLGYTYLGDPRSAVYAITLSFPHTAANLSLTLRGSNLEGWDNEGWGIDNLTVSTLVSDEVPEPGSLVLMGTGALILGLGRLMRSRS